MTSNQTDEMHNVVKEMKIECAEKEMYAHSLRRSSNVTQSNCAKS